MGQVLRLITAIIRVSQTKLPVPASMFLTTSTQRRASLDSNTLNSGSVRCAYGHRFLSQCALDSFLDCITWWSSLNSFTSVKLEQRLKTPVGTLQNNIWPVLIVVFVGTVTLFWLRVNIVNSDTSL